MKLIAPLPRDTHPACALPVASRPPARQMLIEGSWERIDSDRPQHPAARRPPILLWAILAIAGLGAGGWFYAYGSLETWMSAHAAVADGPAELPPLIQSAAEGVDGVPTAAPANPPAVIEQSTTNEMASLPDDERASQTPSWPAESPVVAAVPQSESAHPTPEPALAAPDPQVEAPQARLPRPRPEPSAFASIERRWEEIRALRNRAGYPARHRFLYRYRLAPL